MDREITSWPCQWLWRDLPFNTVSCWRVTLEIANLSCDPQSHSYIYNMLATSTTICRFSHNDYNRQRRRRTSRRGRGELFWDEWDIRSQLLGACSPNFNFNEGAARPGQPHRNDPLYDPNYSTVPLRYLTNS